MGPDTPRVPLGATLVPSPGCKDADAPTAFFPTLDSGGLVNGRPDRPGLAGAHLLEPGLSALLCVCHAALPYTPGGQFFCDGCCGRLGPDQWLGCRRCGATATDAPPQAAACPQCRGFRLQFDSVWPLGAYDAELREAVLRTKRLSYASLSTALAHLLAQRRGEELIEFRPDFVVPIPMHWWRRTLRGVNNAEIVAEQLARRLGRPIRRRVLIRCRSTRPQKDLMPHERFANVRGAFRLRRGPRDRWKGSRVLLVDDILTTGATCSEAAGVFKLAGAAAVAVAVLARA